MKLLAYTSPARGHLYPVVPILAALAERGHEAHLITLSDQLDAVAQPGIQTSALGPALEADQLQDWQERSTRRAMLSALSTFARRAGHEADELQRAIAREQPSLLLIDVNCWGAQIVAEASGLPWAVYSPYLLPLPSRDAPPFGLGLKRLGGPIGRARDTLIDRVGRISVDRATLPTIGALRARHGLPAIAHFSDLFSRPELLLALTAERFEYGRSDWPANVRLVGPIGWAPPQEAPPWLSELPDPLVLVTCSTERQDDRCLAEAALAALPAAGFSVIATTAAHDPRSFTAPSNSRVASFLPHEAILARAACVICHGGMGITQKALAAGVPVVVVPFGRDQLETARRVEAAAAGVRLLPRRLSPSRLLAAVNAALALRGGAERVSRAYSEAGGASAAADAIEALST
jgi:MGT family glycosyltransferase